MPARPTPAASARTCSRVRSRRGFSGTENRHVRERGRGLRELRVTVACFRVPFLVSISSRGGFTPHICGQSAFRQSGRPAARRNLRSPPFNAGLSSLDAAANNLLRNALLLVAHERVHVVASE